MCNVFTLKFSLICIFSPTWNELTIPQKTLTDASHMSISIFLRRHADHPLNLSDPIAFLNNSWKKERSKVKLSKDLEEAKEVIAIPCRQTLTDENPIRSNLNDAVPYLSWPRRSSFRLGLGHAWESLRSSELGRDARGLGFSQKSMVWQVETICGWN